MKTTIEQVDELRRRANVGYKDAKEALDLFDGDIVEALAYLDEQSKIKSCHQHYQQHGHGFMNTIHKIIKKGNQTFMKITKNDNTILNLPLTIVAIAALAFTPFVVTTMVIALLIGCKVRIQTSKGDDCAVNKHIEKVTDIVGNDTAKFEQELSK